MEEYERSQSEDFERLTSMIDAMYVLRKHRNGIDRLGRRHDRPKLMLFATSTVVVVVVESIVFPGR
jgi:hypothetical protein